MRTSRLLAPGLAALLATAALAGCGSNSSTGTTTAAPSPAPPAGAPNGAPPNLSAGRRAQFTKLRDCLRKQGVDLPAGGPAAGSGPPQIDPAAIQACSRYLPQGVVPPTGSS